MKNNFAVLGLGTFGTSLAEELSRAGHSILVVDIDAEKVNAIKDRVSEAVVADVSNPDVIKEIDVKRFDTVILGLSDNFEGLILAITHLKQEGAKKVIAKANTSIQKRILLRLGADDVILPERDVAERLAKRLSLSYVSDMFEFKGAMIADVTVPEAMDGKSIIELDLRNRYNLIILLVKKPNRGPETIVDPNMKLFVGDELTVIGKEENITKVFKA
jgi:trk system potassium uptake protein TrkA